MFGWMKVGDPKSDLFTFLSIPIWKILSYSFSKTSSCNLGTRYSFVSYGLSHGCSSISTGLVFQLPSVP